MAYLLRHLQGDPILSCLEFFVISNVVSGPGQLALGVASPLFITSLLMFVSGVPMLEKQHDKKYGEDPK